MPSTVGGWKSGRKGSDQSEIRWEETCQQHKEEDVQGEGQESRCNGEGQEARGQGEGQEARGQGEGQEARCQGEEAIGEQKENYEKAIQELE